ASHASPNGASDQTNGASGSARRSTSGPRRRRPAASTDRPSTVPFRKSACVETVQNDGGAAYRTVEIVAATTATAGRRMRRVMKWLSSALDAEGEFARTADADVETSFRGAEDGLAQRHRLARAAVREHGLHRRRQCVQRFALDHRTGQ